MIKWAQNSGILWITKSLNYWISRHKCCDDKISDESKIKQWFIVNLITIQWLLKCGKQLERELLW